MAADHDVHLPKVGANCIFNMAVGSPEDDATAVSTEDLVVNFDVISGVSVGGPKTA